MAGSPRKRARREAAAAAAGGATPRTRPELSPKPAEDAPAAEQKIYYDALRSSLAAELRDLKRPAREAAIRAGRARPRNRAEVEIFASDLLARRVDVDDQDPGG